MSQQREKISQKTPLLFNLREALRVGKKAIQSSYVLP